MMRTALPGPSRRLTRLRALRAIMDGRGVDAVVLCDPAAVSFYADADLDGGVLVVRAAGAVLMNSLAPEGDGLCCAALEQAPGASDQAALSKALSGAHRIGADHVAEGCVSLAAEIGAQMEALGVGAAK